MNVEDGFVGQETELLYHVFILSLGLGTQVQQHLKEGFARRLLLIQTSRFAMRELATPEGTIPPSTYECGDLNIHLNSFYVHLRGALDNLAWALHYRYKLLGDVDENDPNARRQCNLFWRDYLKELDKHGHTLATALSARGSWAAEFKALRDPVAHRIPLYAVPGVATPTENLEIQRKERQANAAAASGNFIKFDEGDSASAPDGSVSSHLCDLWSGWD